METAEISYRVADFLKQQSPFNAADDGDLLALAAHGRVRFFEPNEYILWQGAPHKPYVFVIQQGTVSLWDEADNRRELRDIRGTGDMLGIERYSQARSCLYSARSESDVVIYAFPEEDFEAQILKYPHAARYVAAESHSTPDYQVSGARREAHSTFLHDLVGRRSLSTCRASDSIADLARGLLAGRSEAVAVLDAEDRVRAILTGDSLLEWVAAGGGDASQPVERVVMAAPPAIRADATAADGVLAMAAAAKKVIAVTADGTTGSAIQAVVTARDFAPVFGEDPIALLRDVRCAASAQELRELNHRARAFALAFLASRASVEWLTRFTHAVDVAMVARLISLAGCEHPPGCWCFAGSSGRAETLTRLAPQLVVVLDEGDDRTEALDLYRKVLDAFADCDYLPRTDLPFDGDFYVAHAAEWTLRYWDWIVDPIWQETFRARALFDVRPVIGKLSLAWALEAPAMKAVDRDFLHVLANDCLNSLPPLTFFQDAVVDSVGEHTATFHLEQSALRPIVDVGRVFALAARQVMGRSTLERLGVARTLLPEHEAIFREASDTLGIVLWQQGRVGISQGTRGADLPPALLSRHDRQVLKGGFRSILRLLEFTAGREWISRL